MSDRNQWAVGEKSQGAEVLGRGGLGRGRAGERG